MSHSLLGWLKARRYSPRDIAKAILPVCRFAVLQRQHRKVSGGPATIRSRADIRIGSRAVVTFGRYVRILQDFTGRFDGRLHVGDDVFFNRGCYVSAMNSVHIGNHCMFGEYVSIHDENHVTGFSDVPVAERGYVTSPIWIGDNVWVGAKATILPGVHIGDNAVIGANAVVTKDIPPNSVAVGVPARVIKSLNGQSESPKADITELGQSALA